ncbi:MAG: GNAT family protein [Thermodesulfobacteriota bacterium]|nr:GNAT family protein [Thermodesulfobacteriota bacterium]
MLEGKKITIRSFEDFDLMTLFQWSVQTKWNSFFLDDKNDVEIKSFIQLKKDYKEKRSQALIPPLPFVIGETDANTIGFMRFTIPSGNNLNALMSIAFVQEEHLSTELGKEAGSLILDYLFNRRNLFRVYTKVIEEERDHLDYLMNLGFKLEGTQRQQIFLQGRYLNLCTLGILKEEVDLSTL